MSDDRIAALEKRVTELEAAVRMMVAAADEAARIRQATDDIADGKTPPAKSIVEIDREAAVMGAGAILRVILAAATPEQRTAAIGEGQPADALATLAGIDQFAPLHDDLIDLSAKARAHALTWDDLGAMS